MVRVKTVVWRRSAPVAQAVATSCGDEAQVCQTELVARQAASIQRLQAEQMRLRAELVIRVTALQFEREDRQRVEAMAPGLPRRAALARQVEHLKARIETLLRERTDWLWGRASPDAGIDDGAMVGGRRRSH